MVSIAVTVCSSCVFTQLVKSANMLSARLLIMPCPYCPILPSTSASVTTVTVVPPSISVIAMFIFALTELPSFESLPVSSTSPVCAAGIELHNGDPAREFRADRADLRFDIGVVGGVVDLGDIGCAGNAARHFRNVHQKIPGLSDGRVHRERMLEFHCVSFLAAAITASTMRV